MRRSEEPKRLRRSGTLAPSATETIPFGTRHRPSPRHQFSPSSGRHGPLSCTEEAEGRDTMPVLETRLLSGPSVFVSSLDMHSTCSAETALQNRNRPACSSHRSIFSVVPSDALPPNPCPFPASFAPAKYTEIDRWPPSGGNDMPE
ncbi:hypothetical protein KM043_010948 [Ampulex compressa]|nr:hypothetical protein KM043_010948 [Ampulex compressa]